MRSLRSEVMELKKAVDSTNSLRDGSMSLRSEVMDLRKAVESQTNEIKRLNEKLGRAQPAEKNPARP